MMNYKFSIGLEAKAVPEPLGQWLENSLPVDFAVKQCTRLHLRFVEVTITGDTADDVQPNTVHLPRLCVPAASVVSL